MDTTITSDNSYELRFESLFQSGRAMSFICSADGLVNLDSLSARGLVNYLYARAMVGREFNWPCVVRSAIQ